MSTDDPSALHPAPRRAEILSQRRLYDGYFKLDELQLRYERQSGEMSAPMTRLLFERGDSVAVLPYNPVQREVALVQQFRHPAFVRGGSGWLWEVIAGMHDAGRTPEEMVRTEALEEGGYALGILRHVATVFASPGACSERIHLYVAPIHAHSRVAEGGGLSEHGEETRVQLFALDEALALIATGGIVDAKTVILLQWAALHWLELAAPR